MSDPVIDGAPSEQDLDELFEGSPGEGEGEGEGEPQVQAKPKGQQQQPVPQAKQPAPPQAQPLTREDFLEGLKTLTPQQQRQLTPQEVDQMLQVWNPDEKFIETFFNPEATPQQRQAAFVQLRDGLVKQVLTSARYMIDMNNEQLNPKLQALEGYVSERRAAEMRTEFLGQYPGLKRFQKLMPMISQQIEASGFKANDLTAGYKHLADEATKWIQENLDPEFDPTTDSGEAEAAPVKQQPQQSTNGMPSMVRSAGRGAQGMARTPGKGQEKVGPDGGIWDE